MTAGEQVRILSTMKQITQDDVARLAGVTRSVVSYVLNDNSRAVAPETKDRVLKAIEELGYRPNKFAQGLGKGKTNPMADRQIGIILNHSSVFLRPYYAEIIAGIHAKAHEENYHIRFIRFFEDLSDPLLFNSLIHGEEICGLILIALDQSLGNKTHDVLIESIKERIDNIICVEWQYPGLSSVSFDRKEAALTATRHLLGLGHRHLAYIGENDERISGFRQALIEAGWTDLSTLSITFANDMKSGFEGASATLGSPHGFSALLAGSDEVAIGILRYLNAQNIAVPETLALVSIDNIEMAEFTNPPLSTINVQKANMGRQAVQLLINRNSNASEGALTILLPSSLVVRESSGKKLV